MKRSWIKRSLKPLQRKKALKSLSALPARRKALRQRSVSRAGSLSTRRPPVSAEERAARKLVRRRSGGLCEACPVGHAGTEWHHRVRRSQGGVWSAANGMLLCGPVHAWVTLNPRGARLKGWGLWSTEDPALEKVWYRGRWVLLPDDGGEPVPTSAPAVAS